MDDPLWVQDEDEVDDVEDVFPDDGKDSSTRKSTKYDKSEKLAKCPHCFREFTNLKHHINQQHSQVGLIISITLTVFLQSFKVNIN